MLGIFTLGFRHGFDVDHVAAITDISGSQLVRLRAFMLSTLYALGHTLSWSWNTMPTRLADLGEVRLRRPGRPPTSTVARLRA